MPKTKLTCNIKRGFVENYLETFPCKEAIVNYKELSIESWIAKGRGLYFIVEKTTQLEYGRGKTPKDALNNAIEKIENFTKGQKVAWDSYINQAMKG